MAVDAATQRRWDAIDARERKRCSCQLSDEQDRERIAIALYNEFGSEVLFDREYVGWDKSTAAVQNDFRDAAERLQKELGL